MTSEVEVGRIRESEVPELLALLARAKLPADGLDAHLPTTVVARSKGRVVASAALEIYGEFALLRSVAVDEPVRGTGLGAAMTRAAFDLARARGVRRLYLLTETAAGFFPRFGFRTISRAEVPAPVRQSVEFGTVCCQSAVVMETAL